MAEPFISEIRMFAWGFAPKGWAVCDGRLLQIGQHQPLFAVIGCLYGGDGRTTFALPDLRGAAPMHYGPDTPIGERGGEAAHALTKAEVPGRHSHRVQCVTAEGDSGPSAGKSLAGVNIYAPAEAPDAGPTPGPAPGPRPVPPSPRPPWPPRWWPWPWRGGSNAADEGGIAMLEAEPVEAPPMAGEGEKPAPVTLHAGTIASVGGTPHENRQPYMALNFCMAVEGIWPERG